MTLASFAALLVYCGLVMSGIMALATLIERRTGNSGWIDVTWTFGLGATGAIGAALPFGDGPAARRALIAVLVLAWAARLGFHIAARTRAITEDPRYGKLKRDWGDRAPAKLARMLQMQALASLPLALGIVVAAHDPAPTLGWRDAAGVAVFLAGLAGGAVADGQLAAFTRSGSGGVCDRGLWAWSRHPNYFFECLLWCAYAVIAAGYGWGWFALLAPACITVLLTRISGIPPLEEHMLAKHGAAYRAYQSRTSPLLPLPPKATP